MASLFSLSGARVAEVAKRTWAEILADDVFGRAAQLAYYFFLALFPFLIAVISALSVFGAADRGRAVMFHFFGHALPPIALQLINNTLLGIIQSSGPLKMSFGVLGSLWSASMGMSAVMDTLNAAFKVQETRSLVKQYAVATALTVAITLLLVVAIVIVVFGDTIIMALSLGHMLAILWEALEWPVALALILFALAITYYFAPNVRDRRWHWITPGGVVAVILWIAASIALRIYFHFFHSYNGTYGSLAAVIVLLLWFYISGIAVLAGAALHGVLRSLAAAQDSRETAERIHFHSPLPRHSASFSRTE